MPGLGRIYWSRKLLGYACRGVSLWLLASLLLALRRLKVPATLTGPADVLVQLVAQVVPVAITPMVVIAAFGVAGAIITARDARRRDPVRRFTRQQRRDGMARAGGVCELEGGLRRRCSRPAEHGDHFFPPSDSPAVGERRPLRNSLAGAN